LDKLLEYERNWRQHVNRMPRNRLPGVMKRYSPTGRRNHGTPLKRLLDTWDRNGSTSGPTPWKIHDDDPTAPPLSQFQHTAIPWSPHIRYLGLVLDSKLLFTKHLHTVTRKATGAFLQLFPPLVRHSTLSWHNKLTIYKLLIRPILTYAAAVWSNTSLSQLSTSPSITIQMS
jgi:hypothetical protein